LYIKSVVNIINVGCIAVGIGIDGFIVGPCTKLILEVAVPELSCIFIYNMNLSSRVCCDSTWTSAINTIFVNVSKLESGVSNTITVGIDTIRRIFRSIRVYICIGVVAILTVVGFCCRVESITICVKFVIWIAVFIGIVVVYFICAWVDAVVYIIAVSLTAREPVIIEIFWVEIFVIIVAVTLVFREPITIIVFVCRICFWLRWL